MIERMGSETESGETYTQEPSKKARNIGFAGILGFIFLISFIKTPPSAAVASERLIDTIFNSKSARGHIIFNGFEPLSKQQSAAFVDQVLRKNFEGCRLINAEVYRAGKGQAVTAAEFECADSRIGLFEAFAIDADEGGSFFLIHLLETMWECNYFMENPDANEERPYAAYLEGLRKIRPTLEAIGIEKIGGPSGAPQTLDGLEKHYEEELMKATPNAPGPPDQSI